MKKIREKNIRFGEWNHIRDSWKLYVTEMSNLNSCRQYGMCMLSYTSWAPRNEFACVAPSAYDERQMNERNEETEREIETI